MHTDREHLDTDAKGAESDRPTTDRVGANRFEVDCAECGGRWFVDEPTYERVRSALAFDPSCEAFVCEECEDEYADEEHPR